MNAIDYVIKSTFKAAEDFMRAARRVPEDRLTWKPLDTGRSVLEQAQECAHCPLWTVSTLHTFLGTTGEITPYEATSTWTTLDACEQALRAHLEQFRESVSAFPDARLEDTVTIEYGTFTLYEAISFALWNLNYHTGQVNYIQTLYGDMGM